MNENQREAIEIYLKVRPNAMSAQIRQIRLRAKKLDFDAMKEDIILLKRLAELRIPKGRKSADMIAIFTVQREHGEDIPTKFTVSPCSQVLKEFMESGERLSVISGKEIPFVGLPVTIRQRLNRLSKRAGLPVKASVRNEEVYLERTDIKAEEK